MFLLMGPGQQKRIAQVQHGPVEIGVGEQFCCSMGIFVLLLDTCLPLPCFQRLDPCTLTEQASNVGTDPTAG